MGSELGETACPKAIKRYSKWLFSAVPGVITKGVLQIFPLLDDWIALNLLKSKMR